MVCGRNPWRIASPSDESFNAFLTNPAFLRKILPVSSQCLSILSQIFTIDPQERITLSDLRKQIMEIESFSMDEEELRARHLAAQAEIIEDASPLPTYDPVMEEHWVDNTAFAYDDDTPPLRADSGSPPIHRINSASSTCCSLPPTPQLSSEVSPPRLQLWEVDKLQKLQPTSILINPVSPDTLSAITANPFFR